MATEVRSTSSRAGWTGWRALVANKRTNQAPVAPAGAESLIENNRTSLTDACSTSRSRVSN